MSRPPPHIVTACKVAAWTALAFVLLVAIARLRGPVAQSLALDHVEELPEGRVRRTAGRLDPALLQPSSEESLYQVNREGLSLAMEIDEGTWQQMLHVDARRGFKDRLTPARVTFADRAAKPAMIKLRGGGSLAMPEKPSFKIQMLRSEQFTERVKLKTFYLMNLYFDERHLLVHFAYSLLKDLDLFRCHFQYASVRVNGKPMGMFLVVEPPVASLRRTEEGCVAVYRRLGGRRFDLDWSRAVVDRYHAIARFAELASPQQPFSDSDVEALQNLCDLDSFLRWMAVNTIIHNTDTLDELYVYEDRSDPSRPGRLGFMAWDYDDILAKRPRDDAFTNRLVFSATGDHELTVVNTPRLLDRYKRVLRSLLDGPMAREVLIERLRASNRLRDGLDDGTDAEMQARGRAAREFDRLKLEQRMIETCQQLRDALDDKP